MRVIHLFVVLIFLVCNGAGYVELLEASVCEKCVLQMTCRHFTSVLAILEASFQSAENSTENVNVTMEPTYFPPTPPRLCLNKRCSGNHHCSFILKDDCPGAENWGSGTLTVKFACVSERKMSKYCNSVINLPTDDSPGISVGFARNPGYPRFYSGQRICRWIIKAPPEQNLLITVLDLAVSGDPGDCLEIRDTSQMVYTSCGDPDADGVAGPSVQTGSDTAVVVLASRRTVTPRRGVLFRYEAVGCATPQLPKDARVATRNDTVAVVTCPEGKLFGDVNERVRVLRCSGHKWDVEVAMMSCEENTTHSNNIIDVIRSEDDLCEIMTGESGVPSLIILLLLVVNTIIVFIIYKYRQRRHYEPDDEELGTLSQDVNC